MKKYLGGSFRDRCGRVYQDEGVIYRQIFDPYRDNFEHLLRSGLYSILVEQEKLVPHQEIPSAGIDEYKIIRPHRIPFISYPYEWSFGQLKDAALLTLDILLIALDHGMILKDASAFNIQFLSGRPIFIDTLSFDRYQAGASWEAYRQFCQHFLAPLALMSLKDERLNTLSMSFIDGIPLDLASRMLPWQTYTNLSIFAHVHVHAYFQSKYSKQGDPVKPPREATMSADGLRAIIDQLRACVQRLSLKRQVSVWADYYQQNKYQDGSFRLKEEFVAQYAGKLNPKLVWDLGANTGHFSRLLAQNCQQAQVIAFDMDHACIEYHYQLLKKQEKSAVLPLVLNLDNPSPALGWHLQERLSLFERGPADLVLALALVHHLAIANNVPLVQIASLFSKCAKNLIIEFVPKQDAQTQRLLRNRKDVFVDYHQEGFEAVFSQFYRIIKKQPLTGSLRTIYFMESVTQ